MNYELSEGTKKDLENKKEWRDLTIYLKNQGGNRLRKIIKFAKEEIELRKFKGKGRA